MPQITELTKIFNLCYNINEMLSHKVMETGGLVEKFTQATKPDENEIKEALTDLIGENLTEDMVVSLRRTRGVESVGNKLALMAIIRTELVANIAKRVMSDSELAEIANAALRDQGNATPLSRDDARLYLSLYGAPVLSSLYAPKTPRPN